MARSAPDLHDDLLTYIGSESAHLAVWFLMCKTELSVHGITFGCGGIEFTQLLSLSWIMCG